ncbi:MAG: appr-1-p processing domain-containing protein [Bradymonadales bacterium]|nr:MAG: appr-1-p processing domain-containing protein [Bradymonadales bacterium]
MEGNIFDSPAQVLTNSVNCAGAMGKGLALEFKARYPALFDDYKQRCGRGEVKPGVPYLWEDDQVQILNFPTKRHWKEPSYLEDVEAGLKYLAEHYTDLGIHTLAMPALGCSLGGLKWHDVKLLIEKHLGDISDLEVFVYLPRAAEEIGPYVLGGTRNSSTSKAVNLARPAH